MDAAGSPPAGRIASPRNLAVPPARPGEVRPLALGSLTVDPPVVLAPMAGVTNPPFRALCRRFGAGLFVSEMITARGWLEGNRLTRLLASAPPDERPRSVQVYGTDPIDVGEMVRGLVDEGVDHIDMNFGCPVPKVTRHGGGAAIPAKPRLLTRLVRAAVRAAGEVPVTIKVRKGLDPQRLTYREAGRVAEEEGCAAIGLHARTAADLYSGEADWEAIADLVSRVRIPVLGNGDVFECWDALRMLRSSGCAGVIVGRGCLGRPWLFRELADALAGREPPPPPRFGEVVRVLTEHARALCDFLGEERGVRNLRKWCAWYTKGYPGSARLRDRLARIRSIDQMLSILAEIDPDTPFPARALRVNRAKRGGVRRVKLPPGYLDDPDDDTPPRSPRTREEIEAWERALSGG